MVKHAKASDSGELSPLLHLKRPLKGASESGSRSLLNRSRPFEGAAESGSRRLWMKVPVFSDCQSVGQQGGSTGNQFPGFYLFSLSYLLLALPAGQIKQKPENKGAQLGQSVEARLPGGH